MMVSLTFCVFLCVLTYFFGSGKYIWNMSLILLSLMMAVVFCYFPLSYSFYFFSFYTDYLSFFLTSLSVFVSILMITSSNNIYKHKKNKMFFLRLVMILLMTLVISFSVTNILSFYFFFEFSLVPTMLLIMGWGSQIERVQATVYFLMYTLFASLPLLVFILKAEHTLADFSFLDIVLTSFFGESFILNVLMFWAFMGAFLVKMPMYLFHLWLPKAHVEAPVSGSMILAGVLLKLGGYGVIRVMPWVKSLMVTFSFLFMSLCLLSIIFISLACIRSNDLKSLVAYSSVAHMGFSLSGLFSVYLFGLSGSILMLIGHGVCSSGLFSYINMLYERSGSRSMLVNKGVLSYSFMMGSFMFILSIINMGAPPSMNLFSELLLVSSCVCYSVKCIPIILTGAFLVAVYSLTLFSSSHHGKLYSGINLFSPMKTIEYLTLVCHCYPLAVSFLLMNLLA